MPQFFHFFVPKLTSSLRTSYRRKSSPSSPPKSSKQSATTTQATDNSESPKGPYVELNDIDQKEPPKLANLPQSYSSKTRVFGGGHGGDLEMGMTEWGGIQKTTTVEQYRY